MSDVNDIATIQAAVDRLRSRGTVTLSQADVAKLAEYPILLDRLKAAERQRDELAARLESAMLAMEGVRDRLRDIRDIADALSGGPL